MPSAPRPFLCAALYLSLLTGTVVGFTSAPTTTATVRGGVSRLHASAPRPTMLLDKLPHLKRADLVLASASPRRVEILNDILGLGVRVVASTFEENLDKAKYTPQQYVQENARLKALEVWQRLVDQGQSPHLVIGGDTVVAHDEAILEKPKSKPHAIEMLNSLSGKSHTVFSGVAFVFRAPDSEEVIQETFCEETCVTFATLSSALIEAYVESGEPMDKAGAYGIQSAGGQFVSGIRGCFYNVMGFPMHAFCVRLAELIDKKKIGLPPSS